MRVRNDVVAAATCLSMLSVLFYFSIIFSFFLFFCLCDAMQSKQFQKRTPRLSAAAATSANGRINDGWIDGWMVHQLTLAG